MCPKESPGPRGDCSRQVVLREESGRRLASSLPHGGGSVRVAWLLPRGPTTFLPPQNLHPLACPSSRLDTLYATRVPAPAPLWCPDTNR